MISFKPLAGFLAYHNITKAELAKRMGVGYTSVENIFLKNTINNRLLDKICMTLNISVKDIMRYEE